MAARLAYRILVLGGYGQFGSRIVRTLAGGGRTVTSSLQVGIHPRRKR